MAKAARLSRTKPDKARQRKARSKNGAARAGIRRSAVKRATAPAEVRLQEAQAALRASEERYELVMRAVREGVYDWNIAEGTIKYSAQVREATHSTRDSTNPMEWRARIHPEDVKEYDRRLIEHFKRRSDAFECDYRYDAEDGSGWRWARQHGIAVRDKRGRAIRLVGSTGDITDLKRAEQAAREALERQTATADILKVIAGSPTDAQPVFDVICHSAMRLIGGRSASVMRLHGEQMHLEALTSTNPAGDEALRNMFPRPLRQVSGLIGEVMASGKSGFVEDTETFSSHEFRDMARARGHRSVVAVPMLREGAAVGTIAVTRERPGSFSRHEILTLQTFADQAVIAIENVRLFNETKQALEQQTATGHILRSISASMADAQPVFDAIVQSLQSLFGLPYAVAALIQKGKVHLKAIAGDPRFTARVKEAYPWALDDPGMIAAKALRERQVVQLSFAEESRDLPETSARLAREGGYRSIVFAPLLRQGQAIGFIGGPRSEAGPFDEKQVALIRSFADQAVIAIENARLFNETKEALERQTATAEILGVIASSPSDVQPVFDAIASSARKLLNGVYANVVRREGDMLQLVARTAMSEAAAVALERLFPAKLTGQAATGRAILTAEPASIIDVETDPEYSAAFREGARTRGFRSLLAVPMLRDGVALGAINVTRAEPGAFPESQVRLLQTFADQAVIAIENARLFNETKEALERQTASAEILKVISASPADVQPVMEAIVQSGVRLFDPWSVSIVMRDGDKLQLSAAARGPRSKLNPPDVERIFPMPFDRRFVAVQAIEDAKVMSVADAQRPDAPQPARQVAAQVGYRSMLFVPLVRNGVGIGAVTLTHPDAGVALDEKKLELVQTFADQAVIAIENTRLFNELQTRNQDLTEALEQRTATGEILQVISSSPTDLAPVFDTITRNAVQLGGAAFGFCARYDGELLHIGSTYNFAPDVLAMYRQAYPLPASAENPTGLAIVQAKIVNVADMRESDFSTAAKARAEAIGYRAILAVPMMRNGRPVGAIAIARRERGGFADAYVSLVKTFADQAVIAIENVRLFKELEARNKDLGESLEQQTATSDILKVISSSPTDTQPVLDAIVHSAARLFAPCNAAIVMRDSSGLHLRAIARGQGMDELMKLYPLPFDPETMPSARAISARQIVELHDASAPELPPLVAAAARAGRFRSGAWVPLIREDEGIGTIVLTHPEPGFRLTEKQRVLVQTFADQAVIAIENVRLFKELEEKSRQLEEASKHKSQFLASMSHELRTPLNAILGFNEMILGQVYGEVPQDMREPLTDIQTSGRHLLRLINNVLDLAKIEAGRMELALADYSVQDMVETVRSTLRPLAAEKGLEFLASVPADIPPAHGDGGRLTQCLMNLAGNSLKFTKNGKVEIGVAQENGRIRFHVADTGIGIAPEKIAALFTEFKQSDATIASEYGGTGLGLSITKKFVEMHGGRIWVESAPGKGSTFLFEVPLRVGA